MALLFPWATKEYLLWEMSLAQIILYHNIGIELSYPKPEEDDEKPSIARMAADEVKKLRDEAKAFMAQEKADAAKADEAKSDDRKAEYRDKYGAV
jgi:hypothetical protein